MAEAFGDEGEYEGIEAYPFLLGFGDETGMKRFRQTGDEFARSLDQFDRFRGWFRNRRSPVGRPSAPLVLETLMAPLEKIRS